MVTHMLLLVTGWSLHFLGPVHHQRAFLKGRPGSRGNLPGNVIDGHQEN